MSDAAIPRAHALVGFGLVSTNASRLADFYQEAFDAQEGERAPRRRVELSSGAHGCAKRMSLTLGDSTIELLEFDRPGQPSPLDLSPYDTRFQHLAIVVTDMQLAMERLSRTRGWTAISTGGPQQLPRSAGGVRAFKFRDPDGHPLEFLEFPQDCMPDRWRNRAATGGCSGIDHSALSVANVDRSVHYYGALGLRVSSRTLNHGLEQQLLDGVSNPFVDVVGLAPPMPTPHVELLHYRADTRASRAPLAHDDTAATRLIFRPIAADRGGVGTLVQDPDGHFVEMVGAVDG
jgi:catechol 2,3-dioxygenase-like lactoylglutathione lyase family enzyme